MGRPRKSRRADADARASTLARPGSAPAARLALLTLLAAACRASAAGDVPSDATPVVIGAGPSAPFASGDTMPAFRALQAALAEEEDDLARGILANLRARPLTERERALVESAERVLAGRALVGGLHLRLESEPVPDTERFRLVLVARSEALREVRLRLPPADLKRFQSHIDARGLEGLGFESKGTDALADLVLPPTVERRVVLAEYELPLGRALAVRERWRLEPRSGEIESEGERYPAARVAVAGCERERVSPLVATEPTAPGAIGAALLGTDPPRTRAVLELALRLPAEAREAELAALAPVLDELAGRHPERIAAAEPALRWLTGNRDIGVDAAAWALHLERRGRGEPGEAGAPAPGGLELPAPPRDAR